MTWRIYLKRNWEKFAIEMAQMMEFFFLAGRVCTWQAMSLADEIVAKRMAETECCHLHNEKDE